MRDARVASSAALAALVAASLASSIPIAARAQAGTPTIESPAAWSIAPFVGYARNSPAGTSWGITPDRDHLFVGVHLTTPVLRVGPVTLSYAPNLVPLVVLSNNPRYRVAPNPEPRAPSVIEAGRGPALGAGLSPLGLQLDVRAARPITLYGTGAVGGLWFSENVPVRTGRRFNFTLEWGGGVDVRIDARRAVQLGYKFHHLSNLYTAPANPGVDANMFYAGLRWSVGGTRDDASRSPGA